MYDAQKSLMNLMSVYDNELNKLLKQQYMKPAMSLQNMAMTSDEIDLHECIQDCKVNYGPSWALNDCMELCKDEAPKARLHLLSDQGLQNLFIKGFKPSGSITIGF